MFSPMQIVGFLTRWLISYYLERGLVKSLKSKHNFLLSTTPGKPTGSLRLLVFSQSRKEYKKEYIIAIF